MPRVKKEGFTWEYRMKLRKRKTQTEYGKTPPASEIYQTGDTVELLSPLESFKT